MGQIKTDNKGNKYYLGVFTDTFVLGKNQLIPKGKMDMFIAKSDSLNNILWVKTGGGDQSVGAIGLELTSSGMIYITGGFTGNFTCDKIAVVTNGGQDMYVAKINTDGEFIWARNAGSLTHDVAFGLKIDKNENCYIIGHFSYKANFGNLELNAYGSWDAFITKIDSSGTFVWARSAGGSSIDQATQIAIDSNANVYITGRFAGTGYFGNFTIKSSGSSDIFIAKLDSSGIWIWVNKCGGIYSENVNGLVVDARNNLYVSGRFEKNAFFGNTTLNANTFDYFISKLDDSGNWIWTKSGEGKSNYFANHISVDINDNVYTTGYFKDSVVFGNFRLKSRGDNDMLVSQLTYT